MQNGGKGHYHSLGRGESVVQRSIARTAWPSLPQPTNLMGFRARALDRSRRLKSFRPTNPPPVGPARQEIVATRPTIVDLAGIAALPRSLSGLACWDEIRSLSNHLDFGFAIHFYRKAQQIGLLGAKRVTRAQTCGLYTRIDSLSTAKI